MIVDVLQWNIVTTYDDSWDVVGGGTTIITAGSTIIVKLDTTTGSLSAWKNGSIELAEGPNLFFGYNGSATLATIAPYYQYCQGTTLRQVGTNNSYPYGTLGSNANNSECQIAPTCDLEIASNYVITPATGPGVPDGSIVGTGTSSNGLIKYSFDPNFEYGDPFPLFALPPLSDWVIRTTSVEPIIWTTGANPVCNVTHPTIQVPALGDILSPPGVMDFTVGVTYRYNFQFTVNAPTNQYAWIRVFVADIFDNIIAEKILAKSNFAISTTTVLNGDFQFVATAPMVYLCVRLEAPGGSLANFDMVIDSFSDNSGTPSGPGVEEELNFTGLLAGDYTIYAKDSAGCQDTINFTIPVTTTYDVRYRLEYRDKLRGTSYKLNRLDILQRAYDGEVEEICGGETPVKIRYEGDRDDPNVPLVASNATIELLVETSGQFNDMFLSDDRKYLVKHYIGSDFDSLQLYWTGFIVPEFHSEPYIFEPYPLTITASDGIGELKNKDFTDINENNFKGDMKSIKIISEALKKTGLELLILQGINVFDENMDEDGDPLDQAFVDSRIYYNKRTPVKSDVALKSIVDPFRAQIFQSKGVWWVIRLSDAVGTFPYRIFDFNGEYAVDVGAELDAELDVDLGGGLSPSGTINALFELDFPSAIHPEGKAMFARKTQLLTFVRNYGYFEIKHNLKKDGNLIDTGAFESEDIIQLASGNHTFKDWNVLIGQAGVKYGHETVVNGDSTGAFYFDFTTSSGNQLDTQLYSAAMPLDSVDGRIRLKLQYFITPKYNVPYIRISWTLKFRSTIDGTYRWLTYGTNGAITYDFVEQKNDIYATQFDKWETFDLLTEIPTFGPCDQFEISFFFHDHRGRDFVSISDFKAFDPSTLSNPNGARRLVRGNTNEFNVYTAEYSLEAEDLPKVVHPDNYDSGDGDHRWLWVLDKIIALNPDQGLVSRIKFDNVSLAFYPLVLQPTTQYIDPPETLTYSEETDPLVIPNFTKEVMLGDMIRFDTTLTRNEKNLYRGYFRLEDGTPTQNWHRLGVDESKRLLQILLEDYRDQFRLPQRRLSGLKITTEVLHFVNCLRDNVDGTRYRPMTFEFDTKNAMYTPDMSGVLAGESGDPPLVVGEFDPEEFSDDFNTGE